MSNDKLNELLGVDPALAQPPAVIQGEVVPAPITSHELAPVSPGVEPNYALERDFNFARDTIRDAIQRVSLAAVDAVTLAQSGDSPRAYEVVGNMLTAIVNANKELVDLHRSREETKKTAQQTQLGGTKSSEQKGVTIEKAVFVGRAADLLREIRALQKKDLAPSTDEEPSE